jgi:hypothetical protein
VPAALAQIEETLGDPSRLRQFREVIDFLAREISGDAPQIEKNIAKKLILRYRNDVLAEVKVILASRDSYEPEFLDYWSKVMEVFVDARLADDPEFIACKKRMLARRGCAPDERPRAADAAFAPKERQVADRQGDPYARIVKEVRTMLHAKSLRGIGESLEMLRLRAFSLEKNGDYFILRSESLTSTHEWIVRNNLAETVLDAPAPDPVSTQLTVGDGWLCYGPLDIARLNARQGKTPDNRRFQQTRDADKLAQLLRTLGEHLDSKGATAFKICWAADSVSVEYQTPNGVSERKDFTVEKLQQLASCSRFRRPSRSASMGGR